MPVTKLGRLVEQVRALRPPPGESAALGTDARPPSLQGKIKSIEQIYLHSLPVKEYQIVDHFLGSALKDEVMKASMLQGCRKLFIFCTSALFLHQCGQLAHDWRGSLLVQIMPVQKQTRAGQRTRFKVRMEQRAASCSPGASTAWRGCSGSSNRA